MSYWKRSIEIFFFRCICYRWGWNIGGSAGGGVESFNSRVPLSASKGSKEQNVGERGEAAFQEWVRHKREQEAKIMRKQQRQEAWNKVG